MLTAITFAELQQGVVVAGNPIDRADRMEKLGAAIAEFDRVAFDGRAAARFGRLASMAVASGRGLRRRKLDLMIAAIAAVNNMPLFTRNVDGFKGREAAVTVVEV
ncbi:PIN domain-containing protein [Glycomyces sp. NPDC049804]|uniref:PIN domain-containing protein n=1 Tax=Glycomyces sp. NPDC049804 TaxID=3154363 RepID=UPI003433DEE3